MTDYSITVEPLDKNTPALVSKAELKDTIRALIGQFVSSKFTIVHQALKFEIYVSKKEPNTIGYDRIGVLNWRNGDSNTGWID